MKRSVKLLALCLCGWMLTASIAGCNSESAPIHNANEPAPSSESQPYTAEDVFRKLTGAKDMRLSVSYIEADGSGVESISESAVLEKDGDLIKVSLKDNDEDNLYYYDLSAVLGYQKDGSGKWESSSVAESIPDWTACLQQAFAICDMSNRIEWLFSSDTYESYDAKTGKCLMKQSEMVGYFGENWSEMTAYLMQDGNVYYLYLSTRDDLGSCTYKLTMEYTDVSVKLPQ